MRSARRWRSACAVLVLTAAAAAAGVQGAQPASAQGPAPGAPGSNASWNEPSVTGFADSLGAGSKVWYTIGNGELENAFYPQTDTPDTAGLQYVVTDGSTFTETETTGTTHATSLLSNGSLVWRQVNTAANGDFTITKTYVADPARSVIDIQTTFDNTSSAALKLYVDYHPQLDNDGMGNTGGTDSASGDLAAANGSVASALAASTGFGQATTGYVGSSSDGETMLTASHGLSATYPSAASGGHIDQVAQIPVAASGSTTFTLALAFGSSESAAVTDASASLGAGFSALENSFESGWQSWLAGLNAAPSSVTGSAGLQEQYWVSLMEVKADEDKTFTGAFVAAPNVPWGASVSADTGTGHAGAHGYHAVWTRDEYEMATALLAAGDKTDAQAALNYIFANEVEPNGAVKQNTWLDGTPVFGSLQMDEVADPIILAYQLGATSSSDWTPVQLLANYLVANGPSTPEERWEEAGGYSPATMAAEIAGLLCAASIAEANGDASLAVTYQATAQSWASRVDRLTYTNTGPDGNGSYFLRITPDGQPDAGTSIGIANGGGSHDDRTVVDPSFLELVRLGVKAANAGDITGSIPVADGQTQVNTPEGPVYHRYSFDGYGETASGADFTSAGVGNPWPVLAGERGEYDVADGNLAAAQSALQTMAGAANGGFQISEQVWGGSGGPFTFGQPDNSSTPLMWAMAQYVRLAIDISAGTDVDTPAVVVSCLRQGNCPVSEPVKETVNVIVPVNTDAPGQTVYLAGNLSALGLGQADWASNGIPMRRVSGDEWTATVEASSAATLSYKYDLGGSWNNAEQTSSCASVSNRSMSVNGGTVTDTVANWTSGCGSSGAVINVTVPASTPSGDTVYLSGNYDVLGTGIPAYHDWIATDYPMIKTGPSTWSLTITGVPVANFQYKFTLGSWNTVEETSSCGFVPNRTFAFDTPSASFTATDTVATWQNTGSC